MGFMWSICASRLPACDAEYSYLVSIRKLQMRNYLFPIRKGGIFCSGKETEGLRGGVHRYAAQASLKVDAARAEKHPFRTETI